MPTSEGEPVRAYDKLLNEDSLSNTSTTKETNLPSTSIWRQEIDNLDTSDKYLGTGGLFNELGSIGVNRVSLAGFDGSSFINRVTSHVHNATKGAGSDWNRDGGASVGYQVATYKTFGT